MDKKRFENDKLRAADILSGVKQEKFSEANLAEDLFQLFGDFFAGEAKLNKNTIEVAFLNGQRFNIKVTKNKAKLK